MMHASMTMIDSAHRSISRKGQLRNHQQTRLINSHLAAIQCQILQEGGIGKRGICITLSEIDLGMCDKSTTIQKKMLRFLRLMHGTNYLMFCAKSARNLRQIYAARPLRTHPFSQFLTLWIRPPSAQKSGEKETININNFSGLSRERVGVKFVYVLPFSWGRRETQKKILGNLRKMPGQSRDNPGTIP